MGGGTGYGYNKSPSSPKSFFENIESAALAFPRDNTGRFGRRGRRNNVQQIDSRNPEESARRLFNLLSRGGKYVANSNPDVLVVKFDDGTYITYRAKSRSGSPAVDIRPGRSSTNLIPAHKIHFEMDKS
jgi:hypothetical protein